LRAHRDIQRSLRKSNGDIAGAAGGDGSLASLMSALDLDKFTAVLEAEDIKTVADLKGMELNDLKAAGLSIGAARKVLNAVGASA
jgi:TRAP-type uncharacterized transport system substrate-binding protein